MGYDAYGNTLNRQPQKYSTVDNDDAFIGRFPNERLSTMLRDRDDFARRLDNRSLLHKQLAKN